MTLHSLSVIQMVSNQSKKKPAVVVCLKFRRYTGKPDVELWRTLRGLQNVWCGQLPARRMTYRIRL